MRVRQATPGIQTSGRGHGTDEQGSARRRGRRAIGGLLVAIAWVGGALWFHNSHTGTFWDDVRDGECIEHTTLGALQTLQGRGYRAPEW